MHGERPRITELFTQMPTKENLRAFETDLEKDCWVAQRLRPTVQYVRFVALHDAGDKALLGKEGWFFYQPAVRYLTEPLSGDSRSKHAEVVSAIVLFRDELAQHGIKLVVIIVPNKASIYPNMLTRRAEALKQPINPKTLEIMDELRKAGVDIVDLFKVFADARDGSLSAGDATTYYLSQDSHWSPDGMRLAAYAVARRILDSGLIQKGNTKYSLKSAPISRHGDVLKMIQVPQIENLYEAEKLNCTQVVNATTGRLYEDDPDSEVLVMGDSFLRIYSRDEPGVGGFIEHLAYELGFPLASIINDGGASTLVRQDLSRKPALLNNKKLVIWEFVERDIRFGVEGWQHVPLPNQVSETANPLTNSRGVD